MAAGFAVGGAVTDLNGLAIPRARVRQVRHNSEAEASVKTDALGNFALKNMKAGELTLSVQAGGFAAQVKTIQVPVKGPALQFQLGPGCLLRGHIVDENGRPIPQARVETATDSMSYRKVEWSTKTGAAGRFEWDSAPQESLLYTVSANGFRPADPLTLPADGSDHEIKLTHMRAGIDFVQITGTAVDADTSQPLDAFTVGIRRVEPTWVVPFEFGTSGKEGKFSLLAPGTAFHTNYQLQLKKDGYLPALSDILLAKDENQTLAFKLQKGSGPAGTVLLPGGEPAPNATVYLCTSQSGVTLQGPAHVPKGLNTTAFLAKTDESGRFTLAAATSPEGLIVIHEQGFAQLSLTSFTASSNITLQAWGRIEGRVVLDSKPVANESIFASHQDLRYDEQGRYFGFLTYTFETNTDSAGKFSFEKVPPGPCSVSRKNQGHTSHVMISSGAVTQVVLGGTGRPIVGNAVLPGATGAIDWSGARINLTSKTGTDPGPYPKRENFQSPAAFVQAMTNWGSAYDAQLHFSTVCENTGAFRLQDVPSGTYELEITLRETQRDSVSPIAILVRAVIVPEIPGGHNDEPLDLGTLALVPQKESAAQQ
jgi:uncharacterized GH25 family protein